MKYIILSLLLPMSIAGLCQANTAEASTEMWREPQPVVRENKYYSLIIDCSSLKKAIRSVGNNYLFSPQGAGARPLVLIGTPVEITEFLLHHETQGIANEIAEWPDIYMGMTKYVPGKRFIGLFPLNDLLITAVEQAQRFLPFGSISTDAAGMPHDLQALNHSLAQLQETQKSSGRVLYVKFSYLPEDGMSKIGSKQVSFGNLLKIIQKKI